jgi:hypothetical protein
VSYAVAHVADVGSHQLLNQQQSVWFWFSNKMQLIIIFILRRRRRRRCLRCKSVVDYREFLIISVFIANFFIDDVVCIYTVL